MILYGCTGRAPASADSVANTLIPASVLRGNGLLLDEFLVPSREEYPLLGLLPYFLIEREDGIHSAYSSVAGLALCLPFGAAALFTDSDQSTPAEAYAWARSLESPVAALLAALSVLFVFNAAYDLTRRYSLSIGTTAAFALCSSNWSLLSTTLFEQSIATPFLAAALWICVRMDRRPTLLKVLSILTLLALAIACRRTSLPLSIALGVWTVLRCEKNRGWALLGSAVACLVVLFPLAIHNWELFGSLQGRPTQNTVDAARSADALAGILLSPSRGLFIYCPFVLLGALGVTRNSLSLAIAAGLIGHVLAISIFRANGWWGGNCFGPRYLAEAMPAFTVLALFGFESLRGRIPKIIAASIVLLGFPIHACGALLYPAGGWDAIPATTEETPRRLWDWQDNPLRRIVYTTWRHREKRPDSIKDWQAEYSFPHEKLHARPGQIVRAAATVFNASEQTWRGYPKLNGSRLMTMRVELFDENALVSDQPAAVLYHDVRPGETWCPRISFRAPNSAGALRGYLTLAQEKVATFEDRGVPPIAFSLVVPPESPSKSKHTHDKP